MARVRKDILWPGTYRLGDGRSITFTPEDVRHHHARLQGLLAEGIPVPLAWKHATRQELEDDNRHNLGFVASTHLDGDTLWVEAEVPNPTDAERIPSVRYCSPGIEYDWIDGHGRHWPGPSILHVAATPRPVNHQQRPFQVQMGRDGKAAPVWLDLSQREDGMAEEKDKEKDKAPPPKKGDGDSDDKGASSGDLKAVVEALQATGMAIPEEVKDWAGLVIAIKASSGGGLGEGSGGGEPPPPATEAPPPPMMMALQKRVLDMERERLEARIRALDGKVPPAVVTNLLGRARSVNLSLDDRGQVARGDLTILVEGYEALPRRDAAFLGRDQDRKARAVPLPEIDQNDQILAEARKDAARASGQPAQGGE